LVKRAMKERNVDDRAFDARKVLTLISRAKNSGVEPQPKADGLGDDYDLVAHVVFPLYQLALKAQGAVDFDDLIVMPSTIFEKFPEVLKKYTDRFRYLMVDEYQDTNKAQLKLLVHLAGKRQNVCVVGDDDQCIYSWRGAEVKNILDFEKYFPGGKTVRLEQNYRSFQPILDAANAVIEKLPERRAKRMWTDQKGGEKISVVCAPSEEEEARYVALEIKKALSEGVRPGEIAVLYRTNGQARPIEEALREKDVFYEVLGGSEFFERREVKDVIAYFKVIANPKDEISLLRIVNVPARGIGDVTLERIAHHAVSTETPMWKVLSDPDSVPDLPRGAGEKVKDFCSMIEKYRSAFNKGNLADITRRMLEEINFADHTRATTASLAAGARKVKAVEQMIHSLDRYEQREGPKASLLTYLNRLSLDSKDEEEHEVPGGGKVTLMTLHGAKGLEWKLVFLIGLEEDLLPHAGMQGEPPNPEEERRLCYVGITRAREKLVMTRAAMRIKRQREVQRTPSRFLQDLPPEVTELIDLDGAPSFEEDPDREKNFFADLKERLRAKEAGKPQ
jgi:DNA helicase II / ATP-dependent DNA helicase PcrA